MHDKNLARICCSHKNAIPHKNCKKNIPNITHHCTKLKQKPDQTSTPQTLIFPIMVSKSQPNLHSPQCLWKSAEARRKFRALARINNAILMHTATVATGARVRTWHVSAALHIHREKWKIRAREPSVVLQMYRRLREYNMSQFTWGLINSRARKESEDRMCPGVKPNHARYICETVPWDGYRAKNNSQQSFPRDTLFPEPSPELCELIRNS